MERASCRPVDLSAGVTGGIATAVAAVLKRARGRGPTTIRVFATADLVAVVTHAGQTRLEQTLIDGGHAATVAASRRDLSLAITDDLRRVIEQQTDHRVTAHLPMSDPATDTCADVFILTNHPANGAT